VCMCVCACVCVCLRVCECVCEGVCVWGGALTLRSHLRREHTYVDFNDIRTNVGFYPNVALTSRF
jgi:hypothetical protein